MSQDIDFSALENITFNGELVKTMVVDGQTIWAKMESSDIYYVGQTVTIDGDPVVVTEINGTSVTGGGTTVDTSSPGGVQISTTDPNANTTDYTVGQTLYIDGDEKTITSISGSDITFSDGSSVDTSSPGGVQISTTDPNANEFMVSGGWDYTLYVKSDGSLWSMGKNNKGQLGDGTTTNKTIPQYIEGSNVSSVAAGNDHSLYLKSDGSLWAMGNNAYGQLGDGTTTNRKTPVQVLDAPGGDPVTNVVSMAAGFYHSLYVTSDGSLWAMGYNLYGQLGDGTTTTRSSPVQVLDAPAGNPITNVVSAAAGWDYTLYVKSDGSLWAMGANNYGQLGVGTTTSNTFINPVEIESSGVISAAVGDRHGLYLKVDGSLWSVGGLNNFGQLGDGTTTNRNSPVQVLDAPGGDPVTNVVSMAAGGDHSLYAKSDGSLWAMGYNNRGQLGDGTTTNRSSPVQVLNNHQFGDPVTNVISVAAGRYHNLYITSDGSPWGMGSNGYGQLGDRGGADRSNPVSFELL